MQPVRGVLFFLSDLHAGGAQRTMINLVRHWPEDRPRPTFAVASVAGDGRDWTDGITPQDLGCERTRQAFLPLRRLIRRTRPAILCTTLVHANVVAAASIAGLRNPPKLVARETHSHRMRGDLSLAQRAVVGRVYRRAAAVIAQSKGMRGELIEDYRLEPGRVVRLHNPVDIDGFRSGALGSARPWRGEGPMVVAAGRLVWEKGFDILLHAFAGMRSGGSRLAILGEGPERAGLWKLAGELGVSGRLIMPGHIADPAPWFAHAAAFALSSRWEGLPHVLIEAMACGVPVAAFDCPHGPTEILDHGETGLLLPPEDSRALSQALDRLIEDRKLADRLRDAGRTGARRFAAPVIAGQYAALFDSLDTGGSNRRLRKT